MNAPMKDGTRKRKPSRPRSTPEPRRIVFLACPQFVLLDLAGPWDVFSGVNLFGGLSHAPYSLEVVTATDDLRVDTQSNLRMLGYGSIRDCKGPVDTLIVPAAFRMDHIWSNPAPPRRFRQLAARSRRVASVCETPFSWPQPDCSTAGERRRIGVIAMIWPALIQA